MSATQTKEFQFLDPGRMEDGELELVAPSPQWLDDVLAAAHHPLTFIREPRMASVTRAQWLDYLRAYPSGRQAGNADRNVSPGYHFWMRLKEETSPLSIAGGVALRIGQTEDLLMYTGHIGYHVYPPARGHHYAERACRLLLPLARRHGMQTLWITCNPDNWASRRTCERLGAQMVEIVPLPPGHPLVSAGEREKCRYRLEI